MQSGYDFYYRRVSEPEWRNKVNILSNISDTLTCCTITVLVICNSRRMYIFLRIMQTDSTSLVSQITKLGYNTLSILQPTIIIIKDLIFLKYIYVTHIQANWKIFMYLFFHLSRSLMYSMLVTTLISSCTLD